LRRQLRQPAQGAEYFVHAGEVLPANYPAVKGREELFRPEDPMEQAMQSIISFPAHALPILEGRRIGTR